MSIRVDDSPLIASSVVVGDPGHGVLASSVPSTGEHGPGYIYDQITALSLTTEEVRGLITTPPASGELVAFEDSSFEFTAPDGAYSFQYQLYVDGVSTGTTQTVDITIGAGTTITASGAVQGLSTHKSDVSLNADIAGSLHTSEASSYQSQVYLNRVIGADVQGITLSVSNASLSSDREILAAGQQISLQSFEAGISLSSSVSAALYSAELVTRQAGVSLDTSIAAQLAQVALLASVATVSQGVQSGAHGSELSANRATVSLDIQVAGTLESVGLTALAASVGLGRNIDAFIQNISLTPRGVELVFDSAISASTESVELATFRATLANSEAALLVPGLEYTIPDNVGHFTVPVSKTGYTIPINRIHFTFLDED